MDAAHLAKAEPPADRLAVFAKCFNPPMPERPRGRPRGTPFAKGISGNPNGRPIGARNNATLAAQAVLEEHIARLMATAITLAEGGNTAALKLCIDRAMPRGQPVPIDLPAIEGPEDCLAAMILVLEAAAAGEIPLAQAQSLSRLIDRVSAMIGHSADGARNLQQNTATPVAELKVGADVRERSIDAVGELAAEGSSDLQQDTAEAGTADPKVELTKARRGDLSGEAGPQAAPANLQERRRILAASVALPEFQFHRPGSSERKRMRFADAPVDTRHLQQNTAKAA